MPQYTHTYPHTYTQYKSTMTIEQKIELLRAEWKANPEHRDRIELQAKVLKLGLNALFKHEDTHQTTINKQTIPRSPV